MTKDQSITNMRVLAAFAVIILHASVPWVLKVDDLGESTWVIGNIFDSLMRWCVPIFFMVSGATLLGKKESIKDFYRKRMGKIFLPFIFWTIFYSIFNYYKKDVTVVDIVKQIPNQAEYHLWFLYVLISIYAITPFVRKLVVELTKKEMEILLSFWLLSTILFPTFERILEISIQFDIPLITNYLGYFLLGYYLYIYKPKISLIWFFVGGLVTIFGTYYFSIEKNYFDGFFYRYLSMNVCLMAVSLFSFIQNHPVKIPTFDFFDKVNFGMYLVHIFVLQMLQKIFYIDVLMGHPLWTIPMISIITIIISALIAWLFSKIPLLKKTI